MDDTLSIIPITKLKDEETLIDVLIVAFYFTERILTKKLLARLQNSLSVENTFSCQWGSLLFGRVLQHLRVIGVRYIHLKGRDKSNVSFLFVFADEEHASAQSQSTQLEVQAVLSLQRDILSVFG